MEWVATYSERGLSLARVCAALGISSRTVARWHKPNTGVGRGGNPRPYNALTLAEKAVRASLVARRDLADATSRDLSFYALEREGVYISAVSFHRYLIAKGIHGERIRRQRQGRLAPAKDWVQGPNELWCWDATRLHTYLKGQFYYLFMLQDWYSAYVVAWILVDRERSQAAVTLWDEGLSAQGFFAVPAGRQETGHRLRPKSLSDHGAAMKSRKTRLHLSARQVEQLFARPRTPNDNPLIESTFGVLKTRPNYPERLGMWNEWDDYLEGFFKWYNFEHKHSRKGFVTPFQVHHGLAEEVIKSRKLKIASLLAARKRVNLALAAPAAVATTFE
jgi:putative transposase